MAESNVYRDFEDELLFEEYEEYLRGTRQRSVVIERGDPFNDLNDRKFQERFRLTKRTALTVVEQLSDTLEFPTDRNFPISPMNRVLTALRFYATGAFHILVGDSGNMHRTTCSRIVHQVSAAIAAKSRQFIKFPVTRADQRSVFDGFYGMYGFPGVIGVIDCTHIRIRSPGGEFAETFRNRKGYFSINCQAICDHNLLIRDIVAKWPGSVHDSTIFRNSARRVDFHNRTIPAGYLLGDSGYACQPYLLTPLLNPQTQAERAYNGAHIGTRNTIERLFGVWKRRFPALSVGLQCDVQNALTIIVATAVLHNMAIASREDEPPEDPEVIRVLQELQIQHDDAPDDEAVHPNHLLFRDDSYTGRAVRQVLINQYFN